MHNFGSLLPALRLPVWLQLLLWPHAHDRSSP